MPNSVGQKLLIMGRRITYLLRDEFTTDAAAPLSSPRTAEPGPGTLTILDTNSKLSIVGGKLIGASGGPSAADPGFYGPNLTRVAGRAVLATVDSGAANNLELVGYGGAASAANFLWRINVPSLGLVSVYDNAASVNNLAPTEINTLYTVALVARATGMYFLMKGGIFPYWRLLWVSNQGTGNALYPSYNHASTAVSGSGIDSFRVFDLTDGMWTATDGLASSVSAVTTNGQTQSTPANFLIEHTITAATGVTQELSFCYADDDNRMIVRMDQGASKIYLIQRLAGSETEVGGYSGGVAQTWTNATSYRVVVRLDQREVQVWVGTTAKQIWSRTTAFGVNVNMAKVSHAGANLIVYPAYLNWNFEGAVLDKKLLPFGDSKTYGSGDTSVTGRTGYPPLLAASLQTASGMTWGECPQRIGLPGFTTAQIKAVINNFLAQSVGDPDYILYNLGVNDYTVDPATFQADTGYILDALHAKWPAAHIYMMRVWCRAASAGQLASVNDTSIPAVIATRSAWAHLGPDERTFLENGDNGTTYTVDGIHPNHAGYVLTAAQWQTTLGY